MASSLNATVKQKTSFEFECSERFYQGVLAAQKKSKKLNDSKALALKILIHLNGTYRSCSWCLLFRWGQR
jgi:hypothetical protein